MPPVVCLQNDIWGTTAKIPYSMTSHYPDLGSIVMPHQRHQTSLCRKTSGDVAKGWLYKPTPPAIFSEGKMWTAVGNQALAILTVKSISLRSKWQMTTNKCFDYKYMYNLQVQSQVHICEGAVEGCRANSELLINDTCMPTNFTSSKVHWNIILGVTKDVSLFLRSII